MTSCVTLDEHTIQTGSLEPCREIYSYSNPEQDAVCHIQPMQVMSHYMV